MDNLEFKYDAFISYRHIYPDKLIAQKLHTLLETYKVPNRIVKDGKIPKIRKVFRDKDELPTSGDLGKDIENALEASRFLIVICSPRTNESQWIKKEINYFIKLGRQDKILALLIEGEPGDSFPEEIRTRTVKIQGVNGQYTEHTEKLRLLAPILNCSFDDLKQRNRERQIKRRLLVLSLTTLFSILVEICSLLMWNNHSMYRIAS